MHCISVQIQPGFAREFDRDEFLLRVRRVRSPEVDAIEEQGKLFLSFNFFTEFPAQLWQELQQILFVDAGYVNKLAPFCVVICEDENTGECLLLHHFDPSEKLDSF